MPRTPGAHTRTLQRAPMDRHRAWQSMRILRRFTIQDLVATAEIGISNVRVYLRGLERAGYVRRETDRCSGYRHACAVFRLIQDTGPQAPTLHKGQIRDLNQMPQETAHV